MYYIEETDKPSIIKSYLNMVEVLGDKIILPLDISEIKKGNRKIKDINKEELRRKNRDKKLAEKTLSLLKENNCNKVIISKKLKEKRTYLNKLYASNINIIDGKWLFRILATDVLDYIINAKGYKKERTRISIAVNDLDDIAIENIKIISKQYKMTNIVTNHISKLKKIEKEILENYGVMLIVGNNKTKSFSKSDIILNMDFPKELINKYNIYENAIIVNIEEDIRLSKKRFNGLIINDYEIKYNTKNLYDGDLIDFANKENKYFNKEIYESYFYSNQPLKYIKEKLKKDKVEIDYLITLNGTL